MLPTLVEELLMSESVIKVYGALRMSVKMFLMWNSTMLIDGGGDANVETSLVEASNLVVLRESSIIHSNANLEFMDKICRVEDILVEGSIEGSVVHFHRARTIAIDSLGAISAS
ncbi:hypothetical protein LOK49_LG06G02240 [Camellia lanceoleosa]|uniref:Uncharacterized protein n=1 Tax=Camellia lanceoleosa TaxID=1840588 RepID=A0ACC0HBT4_9ERIC|nr:hypothetical protein LOK49_LG06G02240 [Camellia lanceoleosa]